LITIDTVSSDELQIDAPVELVWQVLVDFENYSKWNQFCPQVTTTLELGATISMMVDLGNGLQEQVEYITRIEPNESIAWGMENKPGDPIQAERTQTLTRLSDASCFYISVDVFSGEAAADVLALMGKPVEDGFNVCAQGLKQYAEQLYRDRYRRGHQSHAGR